MKEVLRFDLSFAPLSRRGQETWPVGVCYNLAIPAELTAGPAFISSKIPLPQESRDYLDQYLEKRALRRLSLYL